MFLRKTIGFVNKNILVMLLLSLPAAVCFTLGGKPLLAHTLAALPRQRLARLLGAPVEEIFHLPE